MQASGGVHKDDIAGRKFGFLNGAADNFERLVRAGAGPERRTYRFGDLRELFAGRGAIYVGRNDKRTMPVLREPFRELAGGGGFARALQPNNHPHRRRPGSKERPGTLAKQRGQFVAHHFDNLLVRRKLHHHFGANGFGADVGEQFIGDAHVDVAFE